jgi:hypothetical protein
MRTNDDSVVAVLKDLALVGFFAGSLWIGVYVGFVALVMHCIQ